MGTEVREGSDGTGQKQSPGEARLGSIIPDNWGINPVLLKGFFNPGNPGMEWRGVSLKAAQVSRETAGATRSCTHFTAGRPGLEPRLSHSLTHTSPGKPQRQSEPSIHVHQMGTTVTPSP